MSRLNALLNPEAVHSVRANAAAEAITRFVRVVLDDESVRLRVPHTLDTINVVTPERTLALGNLGDGIQRVIKLAIEATALSATVVCLEEPETNLHPVLQRRLAAYLTTETSNQYVIATHSAHMLNYEKSSVIHLTFDATSGTRAEVIRRPHEHFKLCCDLGYRPADLMQSNSVLWVEGPSDRLYLRRWLYIVDPSLREGIDYSIMFYGGVLLSHLSADDRAVEDFIRLRRLNHSMAVLFDSDRSSADAPIAPSKTRILSEYESMSPPLGFAWLTDCRTIENYIPPGLLEVAVRKVHPHREYSFDGDKWGNPLPRRQRDSPFDKVAIAHEVVTNLAEEHLDVWDLRERIASLATFVRSSNGA